jgi:tryptophan synthase beta chain
MTNNLPNQDWFFGIYGWQYIPPDLIPAFAQVQEYFEMIKDDKDFQDEYLHLLKDYVWRPSPLYLAQNLTTRLWWAKIYLKREDLNHTWAHKINHCIGEALVAKKMWKKKLLAETGAWQHGVALATAAALVWLDCEIHMWAIDIVKQRSNVLRMRLLWAKVVEVTDWWRCLKDAVDSAFKAYMWDYQNTFFAIWSVVWPHPYPEMIMYFQSIVGREVKRQIIEQEWRLPT